MSQEYEFKEGFERGINGCGSKDGFIEVISGETIFRNEKDDEARQRGYEAGVVARAFRKNDDE